MKVRELMCPLDACATQTPDTTLDTIASTMRSREIGSIVVFDEQDEKEVGIITTYDVIDAYYTGLDPQNTPATSIMQSNLIYIDADDSRENAASLMQKEHIHHLIVREGGDMVGIISSLDLTRDLAYEGMFAFLSKKQSPSHPQVERINNSPTSYVPRSQRYRSKSGEKENVMTGTTEGQKTQEQQSPGLMQRVRGTVGRVTERVTESRPVETLKKMLRGEPEKGEKLKGTHPFPVEKEKQVMK